MIASRSVCGRFCRIKWNIVLAIPRLHVYRYRSTGTVCIHDIRTNYKLQVLLGDRNENSWEKKGKWKWWPFLKKPFFFISFLFLSVPFCCLFNFEREKFFFWNHNATESYTKWLYSILNGFTQWTCVLFCIWNVCLYTFRVVFSFIFLLLFFFFFLSFKVY